MPKPIIAVTGADGFIGSRLCNLLNSSGFETRRLVRTSNSNIKGVFSIGAIGADTNWSNALDGVSIVVHCAARVHKLKDQSANPLFEYMSVNCFGTQNLAQQAAALNVKRFIFLSSIKVNGEVTDSINSNAAFSHLDIPNPLDDYGISKWKAEQALWEMSRNTGMDVVVVRAPLVYGPGVHGNFLRLIKLVRLGIPLPFNRIKNQRSLIGVDNLLDLLVCCIEHPMAGGKTFLASDNQDISTPDLVRLLARLLGAPSRLFSVPESLLNLCCCFLGMRVDLDRLIKSLRVDISYTREILGWEPPISVDEGLRRALLEIRC